MPPDGNPSLDNMESPFHLEPRDPSFVSYINQRASYAVPSSIQVLRTCPERYSVVRHVHTSEANVRMRACVSGHMSMVEIWLVHLGHSWTWINGSQNRQGPGQTNRDVRWASAPLGDWATLRPRAVTPYEQQPTRRHLCLVFDGHRCRAVSYCLVL